MIERNKHRGTYTRIENSILRGTLLTLDELGLYAVMLSRPDNWEFSEYALSRQLSVPAAEIRRILLSLAEKGFARERRGRYGTVWDLFEPSCIPSARNKKADPVSESAGKPDRDANPSAGADRPMTREEIGQRLIDYSRELRKIAEARKAESRAELPRSSEVDRLSQS